VNRKKIAAEAEQILHNMEIQRRNRERAFRQLEEYRVTQRARQGMLADLREEGLAPPESWTSESDHTRGIPIMMRWLVRSENLHVKRGIVHTLQRKDARKDWRARRPSSAY
jgi:hypothetical protein